MSRPDCWALARGLPPCGTAGELAKMHAELADARRLILALAERVAAQSELLSRRAERVDPPRLPTNE